MRSSTGIYHIMARGIEGQDIFRDGKDSEKFLEVLKECKEISGFKLYAYCLMGNHIHLLLKVEGEDTELIFKRLGVRYVYWYNTKYRRGGHLFQDRYKSEPVEDDRYFLAVLRYIHLNPVKAGLVSGPGEYKYSSYNDYIGAEMNMLTDTEFAFGILNLQQYIEFHKKTNNDNDNCLEISEQSFRVTDEEAIEEIKTVSGCTSASEFRLMSPGKRDKCITELRAKGLSVRQICRLAGISKSNVEKCH